MWNSDQLLKWQVGKKVVWMGSFFFCDENDELCQPVAPNRLLDLSSDSFIDLTLFSFFFNFEIFFWNLLSLCKY